MQFLCFTVHTVLNTKSIMQKNNVIIFHALGNTINTRPHWSEYIFFSVMYLLFSFFVQSFRDKNSYRDIWPWKIFSFFNYLRTYHYEKDILARQFFFRASNYLIFIVIIFLYFRKYVVLLGINGNITKLLNEVLNFIMFPWFYFLNWFEEKSLKNESKII